jgi:hypothetical protein
MGTPTLEEFRRNPELRQEIVRAAHRQRAQEMGRFFARLFSVKRHAPRPRLAPQG